MSDSENFVENEIEDHKADLDKWIVAVETLPAPDSLKGVVERFIRDCKTLKSDMDSNETPQCADLVDFTDRRNSLEIQYVNISTDLQ